MNTGEELFRRKPSGDVLKQHWKVYSILFSSFTL